MLKAWRITSFRRQEPFEFYKMIQDVITYCLSCSAGLLLKISTLLATGTALRKIGLFQSSRRVFVQASISARKPIVGDSNHALSRKWGFVAVYAIAYACMLVAMGYAVWTLI